MANEIDLIVGSEAFSQITKLLLELGKVDSELTSLSTSFSNLGKVATSPQNSAELTKLTEKVTAINKLQMQLGGIEAHKHELLHVISGVNQELQGIQKELEEKYGNVSIDLATGEMTHVSDNQEN